MIGYAVSIVACISTSTILLMEQLYNFDYEFGGEAANGELKTFWRWIHPSFPFCRIVLKISDLCTWRFCPT